MEKPFVFKNVRIKVKAHHLKTRKKHTLNTTTEDTGLNKYFSIIFKIP